MRLDNRMNIQSVKSAWFILHPELKVLAYPYLEGNNKGPKTDEHEVIHHFPVGNSKLIIETVEQGVKYAQS